MTKVVQMRNILEKKLEHKIKFHGKYYDNEMQGFDAHKEIIFDTAERKIRYYLETNGAIELDFRILCDNYRFFNSKKINYKIASALSKRGICIIRYHSSLFAVKPNTFRIKIASLFWRLQSLSNKFRSIIGTLLLFGLMIYFNYSYGCFILIVLVMLICMYLSNAVEDCSNFKINGIDV